MRERERTKDRCHRVKEANQHQCHRARTNNIDNKSTPEPQGKKNIRKNNKSTPQPLGKTK